MHRLRRRNGARTIRRNSHRSQALKLKLDENLGKNCAQLFEPAGYDTSTVVAQSLRGASDDEVIGRCRDASRALVTLDLDFSNPLLFKPSDYRGIAVLRPRRLSFAARAGRALPNTDRCNGPRRTRRQTVDCGTRPRPRLSGGCAAIGHRRGI
ncbi:MAG: DUF5615 family PIN-like protein [Candidatus Binataceae bacterium]